MKETMNHEVDSSLDGHERRSILFFSPKTPLCLIRFSTGVPLINLMSHSQNTGTLQNCLASGNTYCINNFFIFEETPFVFNIKNSYSLLRTRRWFSWGFANCKTMKDSSLDWELENYNTTWNGNFRAHQLCVKAFHIKLF